MSALWPSVAVGWMQMKMMQEETKLERRRCSLTRKAHVLSDTLPTQTAAYRCCGCCGVLGGNLKEKGREDEGETGCLMVDQEGSFTTLIKQCTK